MGSGLETRIQHFDAPALRDFLYNHEKENNGFLQRFVDSKVCRLGDRAYIKVQWFRGGLVFEAHRLLYHAA